MPRSFTGAFSAANDTLTSGPHRMKSHVAVTVETQRGRRVSLTASIARTPSLTSAPHRVEAHVPPVVSSPGGSGESLDHASGDGGLQVSS